MGRGEMSGRVARFAIVGGYRGRSFEVRSEGGELKVEEK